MIIAGKRSSLGDEYQLRVALHWLIQLLEDDSIESIQVNSTGILGEDSSVTVDDIVVLYKNGHACFIQAKKNQPQHKAWSFSDTELKKELCNARDQLEMRKNSKVMFYSRSPFGELKKLVEDCKNFPEYPAFSRYAPQNQRKCLEELAKILERSEEKTYSLVKYIGFGRTDEYEDWDRQNKLDLERIVSTADQVMCILERYLQSHETLLRDTKHTITRSDVIAELIKRGISLTPVGTSAEVKTLDVEILVQQVRLHLHQNIQHLHGTMPLWGVDRWVSLGELFVDVNILEELSSSHRSELDDLWQDFSQNPSYRSLDRIGLGRERQRVSGLEVLEKNTNLMVVGKPGSGKTTYLQRIVTECNVGNLQSHQIPVLIKLREFVEDGRRVDYSLERYLEQYWQLSEAATQLVCDQGRALVLLDGLDEVTGEEGKKIAREIKLFARTYPQVFIIVTCRTQSFTGEMDWKSLRFQFVEVADFNEAQVQAFAEHWFKAVIGDEPVGLARAEDFIEQLFLEENKPIRELAITPILLSLTCAVFHQTGKFYSKRSKLYEEGLELLLEKWDESREIERDEIYRDLPVERKLDLLSYLAVKKFEQEQYVLFEQTEIEEYIAEFLQIGLRDSRAVLRAIESQHGVLIERSQKIWSFSHLTFQEYFAAKYIVDNSFTQEEIFHHLEFHITKLHWREVFLLTLELLINADDFFSLMKDKIDSMLAKDTKLQQFLSWVNQKSKSMPNLYSTGAIRAFYYALTYNSPGYYFEVNTDKISRNSEFDIDLALVTALFFSEALTSNQNIINDFQGSFDKTRILAVKLGFNAGFKLGLTTRNDYENLLAEAINESLKRSCMYAANLNFQIEEPLKKILEDLEKYDTVSRLSHFSNTESKLNARLRWWHKEGKNWIERLREIIIEHRDIGYQWEFNTQQKQLIKLYYEANLLLVDCLNSSCNVSNEVYQTIESSLLLSTNDIKNLNIKH